MVGGGSHTHQNQSSTDHTYDKAITEVTEGILAWG